MTANPPDPQTEYAVAKERIKNLEEQIRRLEDTVVEANRSIAHKDGFIEQLREDRDDWRIQWERVQRDFLHAKETIDKSDKKTTKNKKRREALAIQASLLFLLSSILVNIGTGLLPVASTNSLGFGILAFATATYYIAFRITRTLAEEDENS